MWAPSHSACALRHKWRTTWGGKAQQRGLSRLSLDFLAGPLWKGEFIDGETRTGIPAIDGDAALQTLNDQICELYSSYYEFDSHDQACWFNEEQEKADKPLMLEFLGKLNARIAELNDGSFVVDDQETPRVEAL